MRCLSLADVFEPQRRLLATSGRVNGGHDVDAAESNAVWPPEDQTNFVDVRRDGCVVATEIKVRSHCS
jgi:hypothetical protein